MAWEDDSVGDFGAAPQENVHFQDRFGLIIFLQLSSVHFTAIYPKKKDPCKGHGVGAWGLTRNLIILEFSTWKVLLLLTALA